MSDHHTQHHVLIEARRMDLSRTQRAYPIGDRRRQEAFLCWWTTMHQHLSCCHGQTRGAHKGLTVRQLETLHINHHHQEGTPTVMLRRLILTLIAAIGLLIAAGCEPAMKATPVPGRVALVGDSLAWQARGAGAFAGIDTDGMKVGPGWQAETAQPTVSQDVADPARSPQVLVIALGHNDAAVSYGRDGFTLEDRIQLLMLALSPADTGTCTAFLLPHYTGPDPQHAAGIDAYRQFGVDLAGQYPDRVVVHDGWRTQATEHPQYVDPADGIHINLADPAAAAAYDAAVRAAADACQGIVS